MFLCLLILFCRRWPKDKNPEIWLNVFDSHEKKLGFFPLRAFCCMACSFSSYSPGQHHSPANPGWMAEGPFALACWWLEPRGSCNHQKTSWVGQWSSCTTLHLLSPTNRLFPKKTGALLRLVTRMVRELSYVFTRQNAFFSCFIFLWRHHS